MDEIAVGTINSNEIFILKVHRQPQPANQSLGPHDKVDKVEHENGIKLRDSSDEIGGCTVKVTDGGKATGIEVYRSKQLLPSSALYKGWDPDILSRWATNALLKLYGRESFTADRGKVNRGPAPPPSQPSAESKASPGRVRARWVGLLAKGIEDCVPLAIHLSGARLMGKTHGQDSGARLRGKTHGHSKMEEKMYG